MGAAGRFAVAADDFPAAVLDDFVSAAVALDDLVPAAVLVDEFVPGAVGRGDCLVPVRARPTRAGRVLGRVPRTPCWAAFEVRFVGDLSDIPRGLERNWPGIALARATVIG